MSNDTDETKITLPARALPAFEQAKKDILDARRDATDLLAKSIMVISGSSPDFRMVSGEYHHKWHTTTHEFKGAVLRLYILLRPKINIPEDKEKYQKLYELDKVFTGDTKTFKVRGLVSYLNLLNDLIEELGITKIEMTPLGMEEGDDLG